MSRMRGIEIPDDMPLHERREIDEIMGKWCARGGWGAVAEGEREIQRYIDQRYERKETLVRRGGR